MKLLVTGASGQLGKTLVSHAAGKHEVIARDRQTLDISNIELLKNTLIAVKPECVINTAAYTAVDKAESQSEQAYLANSKGPENLAKLCQDWDIPLIHISTDYIFNGTKPTPYVETDSPDPMSVYGRSKWLGEEAVRVLHHKHIILRVSWVFGLHGNNFVKTIQRLARERDELKIVADQFGSPTSTENISKVLMTICDKITSPEFSDYGTYHYSDLPETTWFDFAQTIIAETRQYEDLKVRQVIPIKTEEYPLPAKRPHNSRMDCNQIKKVFAIERYSWQDALRELIKELCKK